MRSAAMKNMMILNCILIDEFWKAEKESAAKERRSWDKYKEKPTGDIKRTRAKSIK